MSKFVKDYVDGCATCQLTKIDNNPSHVPMIPNEIPDRPFGIISTDFVTDLPESEGFNAVEVVMCRSTKAVVLIPTVKKIDSDGTVDLLFNNVY